MTEAEYQKLTATSPYLNLPRRTVEEVREQRKEKQNDTH